MLTKKGPTKEGLKGKKGELKKRFRKAQLARL